MVSRSRGRSVLGIAGAALDRSELQSFDLKIGKVTTVKGSSSFSCARWGESKNVCMGVLPKQYLSECSRDSLYSCRQRSRSACS
jgi:hypothetical protein